MKFLPHNNIYKFYFPKLNMIKRAQADLLNIIFGIIVIAGGIIIMFGKINLGGLITSMGLVFELIKLVIEKGL